MTGSEVYLFDSHCHLDRYPRDIKIGNVIARAAEVGVKSFFVPGVTGFPARIVELAEHSQILLGWGVHPLYSENFQESCCEEIAVALKKSICRAIGECGFDRRAPVKFEKQYAAFLWQINIAIETGKPLIVHLVGHYDTAFTLLQKAQGKVKFVLHSFAGSCEIARRFLDLGACVSFSGSVLHKDHDVLQRLVKMVPLDRLLVETDSPDQRPVFWPGSLNEPASLKEIARQLAGLRNMSEEDFCQQVCRNSAEFFA